MNELKEQIRLWIIELGLRQIVDTQTMIEHFEWLLKEVDKKDYEWRELLMREMSKLREEYFLLKGKKAFVGWNKEMLTTAISELKALGVVEREALDSKKSQWKKAK